MSSVLASILKTVPSRWRLISVILRSSSDSATAADYGLRIAGKVLNRAPSAVDAGRAHLCVRRRARQSRNRVSQARSAIACHESRFLAQSARAISYPFIDPPGESIRPDFRQTELAEGYPGRLISVKAGIDSPPSCLRAFLPSCAGRRVRVVFREAVSIIAVCAFALLASGSGVYFSNTMACVDRSLFKRCKANRGTRKVLRFRPCWESGWVDAPFLPVLRWGGREMKREHGRS